MSVINNPITEGQLTFTFPAGSCVTKYDEWSFYRNKVNSAFSAQGAKAVDLIYLQDDVTWLIEIKDYRIHPRKKTIELWEEVAIKVRDTLVGMAAASFNANGQDEKAFARNALSKKRLRVVLHLEQPLRHTRLFPRALNPANIKLKLQQFLRAIDPHPVVVNHSDLKRDMDWCVS